MSAHEMDRISEEQHQRLCAWIFGELEGDDKRAFEAELAASSALQAERERLAATIGLVQQSLPAESLSGAAHASVLAAADGRPAATPKWTLLRGGGAVWRVAAGLALVFGALVVVRASGRGARFEDQVARSTSEGERQLGLDESSREPAAATAPAEQDSALLAQGSKNKTDASHAPGRSDAAEATTAPDRQNTGSSVSSESTPSLARKSVEEKVEPYVLDSATVESMEALGYPGEIAREGIAELRGLGYGGVGYSSGGGGGGGSYQGPGDTVPPSPSAPQERTVSSAIARSHANEQGLIDTPRRDGGEESTGGTAISFGRGGAYLGATGTSGTTSQGLVASGSPASGPPSRTLAPGAASSVDAPVETHLAEVREQIDMLRGLGYVADDKAARGKDKEGDHLIAIGEPTTTWSEDELRERCEHLFQGCRIRPHESPGAMFFRCWGDNPFEFAALDRLSTFSVDVDTASYTLARRYLTDGYLPTKAQVRTEEFVNYFDADVPAPERGETFALALELAPSLFAHEPDTWMLRVALRGEDVDRSERAPLALTFVMDVSGSMSGERIGLVKQAIALCVRELATTDSIALVTFNTEARLVSPMVSAASRGAFESALVALSPGGSTNVEAGLKLGYELAAAALTPSAVNRVILLSDGVGNVGETDQARILAQVASYRDKGIYLNAVGVGMGNHNDVFLEQLADKGDGLCHYVDRLDEARRVFVEDFAQTLQPIARDVKVQVEFDPARVERYRLLGYENRAVADADFRNDAIDAGEVNAGHQVVALYELVLRPTDGETPLATARLRWKPPFAIDRGADGDAERAAAEQAFEKAAELRATQATPSWEGASRGYRRDVLVAQFAELLRRSVHARGDSWDALVSRLQALLQERQEAELTELYGLVSRARALAPSASSEDDELRRCLDDLCRLHYDEGCRAELERRSGTAEGEELAREAEELRRRIEDRIRELLRKRHVPQQDQR